MTSWRENTDQPLLPPWVHRAVDWVKYRLLHLPRSVSGTDTAVSSDRATGWASGYAPMVKGDEDESLEQRLDRLESETRRLFEKVSRVDKTVLENKMDAESAVNSLRAELATTEERLTDQTRQVAVDGLQTAALGLMLVAGGVCFQSLDALMRVF